jgi:hypothetical protein
LSGELLFRLAARTFFALLFHEPPRTTLPGSPKAYAQEVTEVPSAPGGPNVFSQPPSSLPISTN